MSSARDIILIGIVMIALGFGFLATHKIFNDTYTKLIGTAGFNQSEKAVEVVQGSLAVTERMDYVVFGVFIAMVLAILISGWFIAGHPIFSFVYFLLVVIGVVTSAILANTWETASQSSVFGASLTSFPITNNILLNLPIYVSIIGFLGLVIVFAKPQIAGGGGGGDFY